MTVVFSKPFADWKSLFGDIVPEHIATTVGWSTGFTGPTQTISRAAGTRSRATRRTRRLVLQRNPTYWGTPGKLDTITFSFITDDSQEVPALQNSEVNLINPASVSLAIVQNADNSDRHQQVDDPGSRVRALRLQRGEPGPCTSSTSAQAIAYGTNRQEIIARTVGEFAYGDQPPRQPHAHAEPARLRRTTAPPTTNVNDLYGQVTARSGRLHDGL